MQTSNYSNRFQAAGNTQKPLLQGRKAMPQAEAPQAAQPVYYAPVMQGSDMRSNTLQTPSKGFIGQLKDKLWHMVSEENTTERPIGISQLTRKTFNVRQEAANNSFFKNGQTLQDYRFNQLIQTRR